MNRDKDKDKEKKPGDFAASKGARIKDVKRCDCKNGKTSSGSECTTCKGDGLVANPNNTY